MTEDSETPWQWDRKSLGESGGECLEERSWAE